MIITSLSGSGNTLEIVPDRYMGGPEHVLAIAATDGKRNLVRLSVTVNALARAFNEIGYALTDRTTMENISAKVAELQRDSEHAETTLAAIESLTSAWETDETMTDAAHAIQRILHPEPPYEFPTREGAVIEAEWLDGDGYASYSRIYGDKERAVWVRHSNGVATTEYAIRRNAKNFRTIYEGIDE